MANVMNGPTFFPRRLSQYVPALTYSAEDNLGGGGRISFGSPIQASTNSIMAAVSLSTATITQAANLVNPVLDAPFGRCIVFILSGAGTGTLIIDGWDYLGQPMSESLAYNGANNVNGNKAFKYIRQITTTVVAGINIIVGCSVKLGLPYKCIKVYTEEVNGGPASVGSLTSPDLTDPATLTTNDPRGVYTTGNTLDGVKAITATFDFANDVNAANNGGLHGIPHFSN